MAGGFRRCRVLVLRPRSSFGRRGGAARWCGWVIGCAGLGVVRSDRWLGSRGGERPGEVGLPDVKDGRM